MRIALFCATHRGLLFLEKLRALAPAAELLVFSFKEEAHEPRFLEDIRACTVSSGGRFFEGRDAGAAEFEPVWAEGAVDLMFAVSWRYMIPPGVFRRATRGSYVFHDSLLPEYRGFAPTVWAIANGEDHTGVTLFEMSERFDEGDVVDQSRVEIGEADPIGVVMERVTATYLALLERNFGGLVEGTAPRRPQDHARATYCCKRLPEDAEIDWRRPAREVANLVRAYAHPYPGAFTWVDGRKLTVWEAAVVAGAPRYVGRVPGRVVETVAGGACTVLTGDGLLALREVQVAGEPARPAGDVVRKFAATLGRKKEETA